MLLLCFCFADKSSCRRNSCHKIREFLRFIFHPQILYSNGRVRKQKIFLCMDIIVVIGIHLIQKSEIYHHFDWQLQCPESYHCCWLPDQNKQYYSWLSTLNAVRIFRERTKIRNFIHNHVEIFVPLPHENRRSHSVLPGDLKQRDAHGADCRYDQPAAAASA